MYRYTFLIARNQGHKHIALDAATEYWRVLFSAPSATWNTDTTPWLDLWLDFLTTQWKKSVNRDLWDQTFSLFEKTTEDESLSWWDENGAWPSVIDEFVAFVKEGRKDEMSTE